MLPFFCLLSADIRLLSNEQHQVRLLRAVFRDTPPDFQHHVNLNTPFQEHQVECSQMTTCGKDNVTRKFLLLFTGDNLRHVEIRWWELEANLRIGFLPNCVKQVYVTNCYQRFALKTRWLPRDLTRLDFSRNRICGSFDVPYLPRQLIKCSLQDNKLSGRLFLDDLPDTLFMLDLSDNNKLGQRVVHYGKLPAAMDRIDLIGGRRIDLRMTKVRETVPIEERFRKPFVFEPRRI